MTEAKDLFLEDDEVPTADAVETFVVDSDQKADWCIRKIKEINEETERWSRFYAERAKAVEESNMFRVARIKQLLIPYLQQIPMKETKTQSKYSLPSGDLVLKRERTKVEHDDEALLPWLQQNAYEFVKTKESVDWKSLKDRIFESEGEFFLQDTGEKIPGIMETVVPAEFEVKVKTP